MGYTAKKLLDIARAEIGYKEKASNSQLDNPSSNAGHNNWTKYARDLAAAGYYNGNKNGYAWCDVFVDWCFYQLAGKNAAKAQQIECQTGPLGAGCTYSAGYYKSAGRFYTSNPQPVDQFFFQENGSISHTGIVESVSGNTIVTIEGNASDQVKRINRKMNDGYTYGFGRPRFDAEETVAQPTYTVGADNEHTVFNFLKQVMGLNTAGATGVLANIARESSFRPDALGDGGTSYGICQWHAGRYTNLKNWCGQNGKDYTTLDGQLWYLKYELEKSYTGVLNYVKGVVDSSEGAYNAGYYWCKKFEVPADTENNSVKRGTLAKDTYYPKYAGTATPAQPAASSNGETVYTVQKGDTLSGIAAKYGTTYQKLAEYNGIANPNIISIGQKIRIPGKTTAPTSTTTTPTPAPAQPASETVYTVKKGDTLSGIAARYNTTYQKLAEYNGIKNPNFISVGQKIKIPSASAGQSAGQSGGASTGTSARPLTAADLNVGDKVIVNGPIYYGGNGGKSINKASETMYVVGKVNPSAYKYCIGVAIKKGGARQGWASPSILKKG